jgi:uncharacterized protein Yka (UPF0111/DUF47 family)
VDQEYLATAALVSFRHHDRESADHLATSMGALDYRADAHLRSIRRAHQSSTFIPTPKAGPV